MSVRNLDRFGMCVEVSWREGANDKSGGFKSLLNWRRLMNSAGDRLEIIGVEGEGIGHAVPADDVERVMGQGVS